MLTKIYFLIDSFKKGLELMFIPSNEELYKFYSNRSLLRYSKSINTLLYYQIL